MVAKKLGISRDLIIHPGETIADVLEERGISQAELAASTGVSSAYISNVIAGKKDISAKFAFALEYALGIPKSFWMNLQVNYDAELLEFNEKNSITDEERKVIVILKDIVKYLRNKEKIPKTENIEDSILSIRKALRISNISNIKDMVPTGSFRISNKVKINPYILGAWIRLCQLMGEERQVEESFCLDRVDDLVDKIKNIMVNETDEIPKKLKEIFTKYGIDFSVVKNFTGAPVQGYVAPKKDGTYQMVVTIRNKYADIFWFSLFHELGHIVNGDISKKTKFVDYGEDLDKEDAADKFAREKLMSEKEYQNFVSEHNYDIESIKQFAKTQNVMPYIVIGRLQKEKFLNYYSYNEYKLRYDWNV